MYANTYPHIYIHIFKYIHTCLFIYINLHIQACLCIYISIYNCNHLHSPPQKVISNEQKKASKRKVICKTVKSPI